MNKIYNKDKVFLLTTVMVCLSFMTFVAMVFPALSYNIEEKVVEISGIFAVFGGMIEELNLTLSFNILSLIGYLLPLVVVGLGVKAFNSKNKWLYFMLSGVSLISAIIILLEGVIVGGVNNLSNLTLAFGPLLALLFMIVVFISSMVAGMEKLKSNK